MYERYVDIVDVPSNIKKWVKEYKKVNFKINKLRNEARQKFFFSESVKKFDYLDKKGLSNLLSKSRTLYRNIKDEWLRTYPPQVGETIEYSNGFNTPILEGVVVSWDANTRKAVVKQKNNHRITLDIDSIGYEYMFCNTNVWVDMSSSH